MLGNCYMEAGNYKDALSLLEKSHKMNKQIMGEKDESNGQILMVVGQVCVRQQQFDRAIKSIQQALEIIQDANGPQSEQVGNCYLELANAYLKAKQVAEAIEYQTKAFAVFNEIDKFTNSDIITGILVNLAEMQESGDQFDQALNCLVQAKQILEHNYGQVDRRTCKVKRNISLLYLKQNRYDLALKELKQVEVSNSLFFSAVLFLRNWK